MNTNKAEKGETVEKMRINELSEEWWFGLLKSLTQRSEGDCTPLTYEDCTVYPIYSPELGRTYSCYHVVGSDLDFILKESDENEAEVYRSLNHFKAVPRLRVPKMYKHITLRSQVPGKRLDYIALEHIKVTQNIGLTDCDDQVDGLLMYEDGQSIEAWASAGYELARICCSFWNVQPLEGIPFHGKGYNMLLNEIQNSPRIRSDKKIHTAFEIVKSHLNDLPCCLQNLDLLPINVMI